MLADTVFQSHIGPTSTRSSSAARPTFSPCFNPILVRLQHSDLDPGNPLVITFQSHIGPTSTFDLLVVCEGAPMFQSHIGPTSTLRAGRGPGRRLLAFQSHIGPTSTEAMHALMADNVRVSIPYWSDFNLKLTGFGANPREELEVSIPYWSDFNPIGPARGSPRAALPQVPWRAPFIKVHGPGILPRWA